MTQHYLEITYRHGRALAAYLYLPRKESDRSARVEEIRPGYFVDRTVDGRPIGIELLTPSHVTLEGLNEVLAELRLDPVTAADVSPLIAA